MHAPSVAFLANTAKRGRSRQTVVVHSRPEVVVELGYVVIIERSHPISDVPDVVRFAVESLIIFHAIREHPDIEPVTWSQLYDTIHTRVLLVCNLLRPWCNA
ncbi:hypothetical protein D3C85_1567650 [compost metagenome]